MEELPECPVCLQVFNHQDTIPRVLSCGHSVCEDCLVQLLQRFPNTIRCPACNQLVNYPQHQGPSALPKNIDLLSFISQQNPNPNPNCSRSHHKQSHNGISQSPQFLPRLWSEDFYSIWKDWVLPNDAVSIEESGGNPFFSVLQGRITSSSSTKISSRCFREDQIDFSHVKSFKGHEHRIMAVVFVDASDPLCISGDSEGGIFVWGITISLEQVPLKKWYEHKDWRYSGVHSLAVSGTEYLYTGSGDKTIKAWSLQDYTLTCTMNGHKSVVSSLKVCDGVLYSGSWDGTIRLWCLNDHSLLTVLGDDTLGNLASVLSLSVDRDMLVAAHENGCVKIWRNDFLSRSIQTHNGAILALGMEGKWLFMGGWNKTVDVQELSGDELQVDTRPGGSITCDSVITALLYWEGKLYVGFADGAIKELKALKPIAFAI